MRYGAGSAADQSRRPLGRYTQSPAGYMRGPTEVNARNIRLHPGTAQIGAALFCDSLAGIGVTAL